MASDDFTLVPTWVYPLEPEYHTIISETESFKKDYQSITATPNEIFRLEFRGLTDEQAKTLRDHYKGRYGGYDIFYWKNSAIPNYIKDLLGITTEDLEGRWVEGSFELTPDAKYWDARIDFRRNT